MLWRNKEAVFIMLEVGNVKRSMPDYDKVVDLFNEAFPDYELYPIWVMRLMALRKGVDFLAFYDGDKFIGINYGAYTDRETLDIEEYKKAVNKLSFGLVRLKIKKVK